jgi:transposase
MEAMTKHRSHSAAFKRQVAEEFIAGETLHALSKRHDISRQLIRIWVGKFEAGALDDDVQAADLIQEYEAKIAALERMVGQQALEIELLKGALKHAPRPRSASTSRISGVKLAPNSFDSRSASPCLRTPPEHAESAADHDFGAAPANACGRARDDDRFHCNAPVRKFEEGHRNAAPENYKYRR